MRPGPHRPGRGRLPLRRRREHPRGRLLPARRRHLPPPRRRRRRAGGDPGPPGARKPRRGRGRQVRRILARSGRDRAAARLPRGRARLAGLGHAGAPLRGGSGARPLHRGGLEPAGGRLRRLHPRRRGGLRGGGGPGLRRADLLPGRPPPDRLRGIAPRGPPPAIHGPRRSAGAGGRREAPGPAGGARPRARARPVAGGAGRPRLGERRAGAAARALPVRHAGGRVPALRLGALGVRDPGGRRRRLALPLRERRGDRAVLLRRDGRRRLRAGLLPRRPVCGFGPARGGALTPCASAMAERPPFRGRATTLANAAIPLYSQAAPDAVPRPGAVG